MGKKEMKERITVLAKHKKSALSAAIFALLLVMSAVVIACTNASSQPHSKTINEATPTNTPNYHTPDPQTPTVSGTPTAAVTEFASLPDMINFDIKVKGMSESIIQNKFIFNNLLALYLDANALEYIPATDESNCGRAILKEEYLLGEDSPSPEISIQFRQDGDVRKWVRATQTIADPDKYTETTLGEYPCTKMTDAITGVNYEIYAIDHLNGYLLIQLKYFDEYAEGWANRMRQMLDTIILNEDIDTGQIVLLLSEPDQCKVSVKVTFTEDANYPKYYVPDEDVQMECMPLLMNMKTQKLTPGWRKNQKWLGYSVVYNGKEWDVWSEGLLVSYDDGEFVGATAPEITQMIQKLVQEKLGITPFEPGDINGIISAKLDVQFYGKEKQYTQTVTDPQDLAAIEAMLSDVTSIDRSGCPFTEGYLTLTLKSGKTILLAMGTDSCTTYFVNGLTFDYRPADIRGKEDSGVSNSILFKYFNQIPMETRGR